MPKQKQKSDRALYSDKARSFNQSERALYRNFIIKAGKKRISFYMLEISYMLSNKLSCKVLRTF